MPSFRTDAQGRPWVVYQFDWLQENSYFVGRWRWGCERGARFEWWEWGVGWPGHLEYRNVEVPMDREMPSAGNC